MDLAETIYRLSEKLPDKERFALSDQIRRAAISIPSNIAEGYGRNYTKEYVHFLKMARGSKNELETQLLLCVRLGFLSETDIKQALEFCDEIGRMLNALIIKLV